MADFDELKDILRQLLTNKFAPKPDYTRGLLGDGQGNVIVPDKTDHNYVRFNRGSTEFFEVFNKTVNPIDGWPILIGELPWQPGLTQVVGTDWAAYEQSGWGESINSSPAHAPTHEWPDGAPGSDPVNVHLRSIVPGRAYVQGTGSTTVFVNSFDYEYLQTGTNWPGLPGFDLSPVMASMSTGNARLIGIYLDPSTKSLAVVTGTQGVFTAAFDPPSPTFPAKIIPIANIRVYGGQSKLSDTDIRDKRILYTLGNTILDPATTVTSGTSFGLSPIVGTSLNYAREDHDHGTPTGTSGEYSDGGEARGKDRTLGNTDNFDLGFITNDIDRLHIENSGNVGVGTTTPAVRFESLFTGTQMRLTHIDADTFSDFSVTNSNQLIVNPSSTGTVLFQPTTDTTTFFQIYDAVGTPVLNVDSINERVSIGNVVPAASLHVKGNIISRNSADSDTSLFFDSGATTTQVSQILLQDQGTTEWALRKDAANNFDIRNAVLDEVYITFSRGSSIVINEGSKDLDFRVESDGDTHAIFLEGSSGRLGVGAAGPAAKLQINQSDASGAISVLYLNQSDTDEEMIRFQGTIGTGNSIEAVGAKTLTPTHFIKIHVVGVGDRYIQCGTIA